ncbi:MAG TPA: YbhB/YbcL family Raf kinase inhibitor-like protein [Cytophagaceae bacterium]
MLIEEIENGDCMKASAVATMKISSPAFENEGKIPSVYTCDGANINPPLRVNNIPNGTKSLAIIMEDPDAPGGTFTHWVTWNISPHESLPEASAQGVEGVNDFNKYHYGGPCPPSGRHNYIFKVYALDRDMYLSRDSERKALEMAMQGHIIGYGELKGWYEREQLT